MRMIHVFLLLFAVPGLADQIQWTRESAAGTERIILKYSPKKAILFTDTNEFVQSRAVLGTRERKGPSGAARRLPAIKTSLNAMRGKESKKSANQKLPLITLNGKAVPAGSDPYKQLELILKNETNNRLWEIVEGNRVRIESANMMYVETWAKKWKIETTSRSPASTCKVLGGRAFCQVKYGIVNLPQELGIKAKKTK